VFASYEQLQGYQPDYAHAPSLAAKPDAGATHTKHQGNPLLVRGSIQCQLCSKPLAVFAARSFPAVSEETGMHRRFAAEQLDIACADDNQYVCGSQLFPAGHKLDEAVYGNHSLTCSSLVEFSLYKANSTTLNKLADSFAVSLCSSCGIEHLRPERSEQLVCNQTVQTAASQCCWPLCSICSDEGLVPPQKKCEGTPAAVKRKVVGVKRKRMAGIGRGGARGRGAGRGGPGRGLGRLVCLSS
jgi:hypothetical protein